MSDAALAFERPGDKGWLDRVLSLFTEVRAGEGTTAVLMLLNIFLLLICYSIIKIVREPLILLGGGAEVRSYAAAGQALVLMAFVPFYGWFASRVDRVRLLVGVTLFFVVNIELFALAVAAGMPYVGVAFFIWVGIFNISLIAQFWSFANDIYTKEAGDRLFPTIMIGMTAGAPLGSLIAGELFGLGFSPQVILQISAVLLLGTLGLYLLVTRREARRAAAPKAPLAAGGGFALVFRSPYLRLIALLIVLLNVVNTTGEYLIARLITAHATALAAADPGFNTQAYIGAFVGSYQFWVNVVALVLQAFVASRLVKYLGLRGALLALPLIALGGYSLIAAGAGFAIVRWVKTAENATDYSIMNTARQLLWLPTSREEKYKAKQAIDTFFTRGGDLVSAAVVYFGAMRLGVSGFAAVNVALVVVWLLVAVMILRHHRALARMAAAAVIPLAVGAFLTFAAAPARAQEAAPAESREAQIAAEQAEKARNLKPYEPAIFERRLQRIEKVLTNQPNVYAYVGNVFRGGWMAFGPGYRRRFAESGLFDAHAAWSLKNYKGVDAALKLPEIARGHVAIDFGGSWIDAPKVAYYGLGNQSLPDDKTTFLYRTTSARGSARIRPVRFVSVGGGMDAIVIDTGGGASGTSIEERFTPADTPGLDASADYLRSRVFAEIDWRDSPGYTRRGGRYLVDWSAYQQIGAGPYDFRRLDAEIDQFIPLLRENWVLAFRALTSTTDTASGEMVPFFMMPDLGGSRELRGYPSWRFRDRHRLLLSGEYRWMAGQFVDMALFLDAGRVAPTWDDLGLNDLRKTYGIGVRFHTSLTTVLRVELARTDEGTGLIFAFAPAF